jgi:hypothetical protein
MEMQKINLKGLGLTLVFLTALWGICCSISNESPEPEGHATTVEQLESDGARTLSNQEIRDMIVGKTIRITDLRGGQKYDVFFGEDGTRTIMDTVTVAQDSISDQPTVNHYEIRGDKLYSSLDDETTFYSEIYVLKDHYYGTRSDEEGLVNYEILGINEGRVTIASLISRGGVELNDEELRELLVGKTITVKHMVTGEIFDISYTLDGKRILSNIGEDEDFESTYQIRNNRLEIQENGTDFSAILFRLGVRYYGARSQEKGFISYEIISSRKL